MIRSMERLYGTNIYDGNGDLLQLKGVNLGNWFVWEFWMGFSSVGECFCGSGLDDSHVRKVRHICYLGR
ncbi:MAG: hypothetical protein IJW67_06010 [Blautia sp.]|nr:hypothetical protein [Blautia sp.]